MTPSLPRRRPRCLALVLVLGPLSLGACGRSADEPAGGKPAGGNTPAPSGAGGGAASAPMPAAPPAGAPSLGADLDREVAAGLAKAKQYLLGQRDAAAGAWSPTGEVAVGFTALAGLAVLGATPREDVAADPVLQAAAAFVAGKQAQNGSIASNPRYTNYETSVAIAFLAGLRSRTHLDAVARARDYVMASQVQANPDDPSYGGFPYESRNDPGAPVDLSNAQFAAEAAQAAGVTDRAFWDRFTTYLGRVQNRSETNTVAVPLKEGGKEQEVVSGNDGGAGYAPGRSKAGYVERADGRLEPRSYGSMTYALLKCLLFAGLKADDPRVVAAVGWISRNFTVERNPGFEAAKDPETAGQQGYFYYLLTMARALAAYEVATGKPLTVTDAAGTPRAWRQEIARRLLALQREDGSWANPMERWEEALPLIATSYAAQALAVCQGRL